MVTFMIKNSLLVASLLAVVSGYASPGAGPAYTEHHRKMALMESLLADRMYLSTKKQQALYYDYIGTQDDLKGPTGEINAWVSNLVSQVSGYERSKQAMDAAHKAVVHIADTKSASSAIFNDIILNDNSSMRGNPESDEWAFQLGRFARFVQARDQWCNKRGYDPKRVSDFYSYTPFYDDLRTQVREVMIQESELRSRNQPHQASGCWRGGLNQCLICAQPLVYQL